MLSSFPPTRDQFPPEKQNALLFRFLLLHRLFQSIEKISYMTMYPFVVVTLQSETPKTAVKKRCSLQGTPLKEQKIVNVIVIVFNLLFLNNLIIKEKIMV